MVRPLTTPLLAWPELAAIQRLAGEREELRRRIGQLPANSHRRVVLAARLEALTHEQLKLETALGRSS